jgi:hypothetical protein
MKLINSSAAESKLEGDFNEVRQRLLAADDLERLERPLSYWTLQDDRCLPLVFMGRTLKELIATPFPTLFSTPGVGTKKARSLVQLLWRAAHGWTPPGMIQEPPISSPASNETRVGDIDPADVCESLWAHWCAAIVQQGLQDEPLGCFAASLRDLPKAAWQSPLGRYTGLTLAEIRELKGHGEKRVRGVIQTMGDVYHMLGTHQRPHLRVRLFAENVRAAEDWLLDALTSTKSPTADAIHGGWICPLCDQLRIDAGEQMAELVENRIRFGPSGPRVDRAASRLGVTRARVYQLLSEVHTIMSVRWPAGELLTSMFGQRLGPLLERDHSLDIFFRAVDQFFPGSRRDAEISMISACKVS